MGLQAPSLVAFLVEDEVPAGHVTNPVLLVDPSYLVHVVTCEVVLAALASPLLAAVPFAATSKVAEGLEAANQMEA